MTQVVTLQDVFKELRKIKQTMISKKEVASLLETLEIIHHSETIQQVHKSEKDIRSGRTKKISGIKDLLAEM